MTRSPSDLAADVRAVLPPKGTPHHEMPGYMQRDQQHTNKAHASLSELVALVETLTQERDDLKKYRDAETRALASRLVAAEAALAEMRRALGRIAENLAARRGAAEAALAEMRRALEDLLGRAEAHGVWWLENEIGVRWLENEIRRALAAAGPAPEEGE